LLTQSTQRVAASASAGPTAASLGDRHFATVARPWTKHAPHIAESGFAQEQFVFAWWHLIDIGILANVPFAPEAVIARTLDSIL
jgi:hypothetical protein